MKRWSLLGIVILTILIAAFLCQTAIDPADFTGQWYSYDGQDRYLFSEGLIYRHSNDLSEGDSFCGAYTFGGNTILLFVQDIPGLNSEKQIYLVKRKEEHLLCENKDGSGEIYFIRSSQ